MSLMWKSACSVICRALKLMGGFPKGSLRHCEPISTAAHRLKGFSFGRFSRTPGDTKGLTGPRGRKRHSYRDNCPSIASGWCEPCGRGLTVENP